MLKNEGCRAKQKIWNFDTTLCTFIKYEIYDWVCSVHTVVNVDTENKKIGSPADFHFIKQTNKAP